MSVKLSSDRHNSIDNQNQLIEGSDQANKSAKIWKVHNRAKSFVCAHTLYMYMNYPTKTFLLVSSSVSSKQVLCFVHSQGQKSKQKHTTKNFVTFNNYYPLLTMSEFDILPPNSLELRSR